MPGLRLLDFKKVKERERQEAQTLFKGKKLKKSEKPKTFIPGEQLKQGFNQATQNFTIDQSHPTAQRVQPSKEDIDAIRVSKDN